MIEPNTKRKCIECGCKLKNNNPDCKHPLWCGIHCKMDFLHNHYAPMQLQECLKRFIGEDIIRRKNSERLRKELKKKGLMFSEYFRSIR